MRRHEKGACSSFTLTELLVVMVIVAMLVAFLLPALATVQEHARATRCRSNLRQMWVAMKMFEGDHGYWPPRLAMLTKYLRDSEVVICVDTPDTAGRAPGGSTYAPPRSPGNRRNVSRHLVSWCPYHGSLDHVNQLMGDGSVVSGAGPGPPAIAGWHFDYVDGTTVYDSGTFENDGETFGGPRPEPGPDSGTDRVGVLVFDGIDDYIEIPHDDSLSLTGQGTIQCWMKGDSTMPPGQGTSVFTKMTNTSGGNVSYDIRINSGGRIEAYVHNPGDGTFGVYPLTDMRDDTWHHVAFTWDITDAARLYVDGVLVGFEVITGSGAMVSNWPVWIGRARYGVDMQFYYYKGKLDDIELYDYARKAEDIARDAAAY